MFRIDTVRHHLKTINKMIRKFCHFFGRVLLVSTALILIAATSSCASFLSLFSGDIKMLEVKSESGDFPMPDSGTVQSRARGTPVMDITGVWLQVNEFSLSKSTIVIEFKLTGPGKYTFTSDEIWRKSNILPGLTPIQDFRELQEGEASVLGDEVLLQARKMRLQFKQGLSEAEIDAAKFEDYRMVTVHGHREKLKILPSPNRLISQERKASWLEKDQNAEKKLFERGLDFTAEFSDDLSKGTTRHAWFLRAVKEPDNLVNPSNEKQIIRRIVPIEMLTYRQSSGPALEVKHQKLGPKPRVIVFSGTVFFIKKAAGKIVIYAPSHLHELMAGQKLEVRSRHHGTFLAHLQVETVNHTNAVGVVNSGNIDNISVADAVLGFR